MIWMPPWRARSQTFLVWRLRSPASCSNSRSSVHVYLHTYIHAYMHTCIHACMHACMHPYIHTSIHPYIHTSIHPYIHTSIHPYTHTSIHPYLPTYQPTYIQTYIHTHVSLQIGDITRFIAILIGNMMTIIHGKWGCPTFTAIFWHAAVDEARRPLNQKKHVHINIHTMICYVLKSSDDEWCIFFWYPRRFAWCGLVNISDQKSCVASAALNCNQEATDSKPPPGDWAPYISHIYI